MLIKVRADEANDDNGDDDNNANEHKESGTDMDDLRARIYQLEEQLHLQRQEIRSISSRDTPVEGRPGGAVPVGGRPSGGTGSTSVEGQPPDRARVGARPSQQSSGRASDENENRPEETADSDNLVSLLIQEMRETNRQRAGESK